MPVAATVKSVVAVKASKPAPDVVGVTPAVATEQSAAIATLSLAEGDPPKEMGVVWPAVIVEGEILVMTDWVELINLATPQPPPAPPQHFAPG